MYLTETVESDDDLEPQRNHDNECVEQNLEIESAPLESVTFNNNNNIYFLWGCMFIYILQLNQIIK